MSICRICALLWVVIAGAVIYAIAEPAHRRQAIMVAILAFIVGIVLHAQKSISL